MEEGNTLSTVKHLLNGNNFELFYVLARGDQGQNFFVSHFRVLFNPGNLFRPLDYILLEEIIGLRFFFENKKQNRGTALCEFFGADV